MPLRGQLLRTSQRRGAKVSPQLHLTRGLGLGSCRHLCRGSKGVLLGARPGNAFYTRIKEPWAKCQGNDVLQTFFFFFLVNGNNIYLAIDKQASWRNRFRNL